MAVISLRLTTSQGALYAKTVYGALSGSAISTISNRGRSVLQNVTIGVAAGSFSSFVSG